MQEQDLTAKKKIFFRHYGLIKAVPSSNRY